MAERPPKRYKPGELDAVKKRLGNLSPDEAKRMREILGGEVGIEKSEFDLLKEKNNEATTRKRGRNIDVVNNQPEDGIPKFSKISSHEENQSGTAVSGLQKEFTYIDRVKTDFLCRKPEYNIKTLAGAIGSLFSFFLPIPDYIKPVFLINAEKNIYQPIHDLVKATRGLFTKTREEVYKKIYWCKFFYTLLHQNQGRSV